jgi:cytochrome c-type biogenesis protein
MADFVSLVYPFTAGVFVLFSPCGYALLPGYISYYLGSEVTIPRALRGGAASTAGLIAIFSFIGLGSSLIGGLIKPYITLFPVFAAVILIILGVLILAEVNLPYLINIGPSNRKGLTGFFIFGIAYGLAAAGCTAPIFLSILLIAVMGSGTFGGLLTFLVYALGVGFPLIITSVLVASAKQPLISRIRNLTPRLYKLSGVVIILVGFYLIYIYLTSGLAPLV